MKILFLSTWFPYPPDNGSRIRAYNLLKKLARRHEISLVSFVRDDEGKTHGDLPGLCSSIETVPWIEYAPRRLRALLGFLSPTPRSVVDTFSPEMAQLVAQKLASGKFDVVVASETGTAPYVQRSRAGPAVLDEFQTAIIKDAYERAEKPTVRFRNWLTWTKCRRYVASLLRCFDACVVASARERAHVAEIVPDYGNVHIIPNGVDVDVCRPGLAEPATDTLVHSGALTWSANYDAVFYFLSEILPLIRQHAPDVQLKVTGSTRNVAINRLPSLDGVVFTGYVDDIHPVVAGSWACVVPLRIGGGTRLKILEAMALGTPVVSTSKGAEGLDVTHGENILIADDPREFAAQTVRLLRDPELRRHLAENGRRLVEQRYDWRLIGEQFNRLVEAVANKRENR